MPQHSVTQEELLSDHRILAVKRFLLQLPSERRWHCRFLSAFLAFSEPPCDNKHWTNLPSSGSGCAERFPLPPRTLLMFLGAGLVFLFKCYGFPCLVFRIFSYFQSKPSGFFLLKFHFQLLSLCWAEAMCELFLFYYPHPAGPIPFSTVLEHRYIGCSVSQPHTAAFAQLLLPHSVCCRDADLRVIQKLHSLSLILWVLI